MEHAKQQNVKCQDIVIPLYIFYRFKFVIDLLIRERVTVTFEMFNILFVWQKKQKTCQTDIFVCSSLNAVSTRCDTRIMLLFLCGTCVKTIQYKLKLLIRITFLLHLFIYFIIHYFMISLLCFYLATFCLRINCSDSRCSADEPYNKGGQALRNRLVAHVFQNQLCVLFPQRVSSYLNADFDSVLHLQHQQTILLDFYVFKCQIITESMNILYYIFLHFHLVTHLNVS